MSLHNRQVGIVGEDIAVDYLQKRNFSIVKRNFHSNWAELDIIAMKENTLHFVEVKTRIGTLKGKPYESITTAKLSHLKRSIQYFLLKNDYKRCKLSVDVVGIVLKTDLSVVEIKWYEGIPVNF
ncbi:MAG: YraN family protein [bacterium]|nr:YraN family protein [bacterium]